MGWALLGVFIAVLLLQFSPVSSILVVMCVAMTAMQMGGMIVLMDLRLNAFTVINMTILVGVAVESSAHLTLAFLLAQVSRCSSLGFRV